MRRPHRPAPALLGLMAAALLVACAGPAEQTGDEPAGGNGEAPGASVEGFPLTVSSCGTETTLETPPERIVTIKSSATEMVLSLGAGDRLAGTAFSDGPVPGHLEDAAADVPDLADQNPSSEAVLDLEPELVYAGWESNLTDQGAGDREMYEGLGISTFVPPSACEEPEHRPVPLTFEDVFDEVELVGGMLGADAAERADDLVAEQRAALAGIDPAGQGLTALWWSSDNQTPYVGAGAGAPQMIMEAVGLENLAGDVEDRWANISWEAFADADPDVIILVDSSWNTAENKTQVLAEQPVTRELTAVQEERYVVLPFPVTEPGVRNVPAAVELAERLAALEVPS